ncbi:replication fork protection component Swi3-domain-containing protein [Mycena maculata]|uniref:Chromosome segregation in meiosis protein n=1 Tax=Mycena maculata TaxID=230809 RepID=A0AAD7JYI3_9AGAR|nr:replication fork protection component Swi3-domain-containing protein [Mycena maculata]
MDTSLENIWDAAIIPRSPSRPLDNEDAPRRSRRSDDPLFLPGHGSDDENDPMPDAPPRVHNVVENAFSDVANLPDDAENNGPPLTLHQIMPSSSPAHHLGGDGDKASGEQDKDAKKPKKRMRLDEARLIGPSGFPQLIQETKRIKIKGKGHEASDLNRLLQVYQFWTHGLYPRTPFKDTVDRVEKLCHSKRMHNMLGTWRDNAHGIVTGEKSGENEDATDPPVPGADSDQADYASSSSHAATRPPSSADGDDESDFDAGARAMDANGRANAQQVDEQELIEGLPQPQTLSEEDAAIVEAEKERSTANEAQATRQQQHAADDPLDDLDDEYLWNKAGGDKSRASVTAPPPLGEYDEDEEAWDAMADIEEAAAALVVPQPRPVYEGDSEDMYIPGS